MENIEVTVDNIECKINEEELQQLMEICKVEYSHIPEYFHYVYSVDYLLNK